MRRAFLLAALLVLPAVTACTRTDATGPSEPPTPALESLGGNN